MPQIVYHKLFKGKVRPVRVQSHGDTFCGHSLGLQFDLGTPGPGSVQNHAAGGFVEGVQATGPDQVPTPATQSGIRQCPVEDLALGLDLHAAAADEAVPDERQDPGIDVAMGSPGIQNGQMALPAQGGDCFAGAVWQNLCVVVN